MKTTFNRTTAAIILRIYRGKVRENIENPTKDNWTDVLNFYKSVWTFGMLGIISMQAQKRAEKMFNECTAII